MVCCATQKMVIVGLDKDKRSDQSVKINLGGFLQYGQSSRLECNQSQYYSLLQELQDFSQKRQGYHSTSESNFKYALGSSKINMGIKLVPKISLCISVYKKHRRQIILLQNERYSESKASMQFKSFLELLMFLSSSSRRTVTNHHIGFISPLQDCKNVNIRIDWMRRYAFFHSKFYLSEYVGQRCQYRFILMSKQ